MNREIKFRVWDGRRMSPVDGDMAVTNGVLCELDTSGHGFDVVPVFTRVENAILMQYTGLRDRNGVYIYEGDIVEWANNYNSNTRLRIGDVKFDERGACFAIFNGLNDEWPDNGDWYGAITNVSVIGNIHENPERLELAS